MRSCLSARRAESKHEKDEAILADGTGATSEPTEAYMVVRRGGERGSGCARRQKGESLISSGDGRVAPPVPIPNTEVKHPHVESTWLETAWEDRAPLVSEKASSKCLRLFSCV